MRLALSSAAGLDLSLEDLMEGCRRRGLAGLELVVGEPRTGAAEKGKPSLPLSADLGVGIVGLLYAGPAESRLADDLPRLARMGIPLVLPAAALPEADLAPLARSVAGAHGRILFLHGTEEAAASRLRALVAALPVGTAGLAWQVNPAEDDPDEVPRVLTATRGALAYVRLLGGGPESARQTGLGIGALMARLTLSRYAGPVVLTPSSPGYHYAWHAWLGRAGGWGCGSKRADTRIVALGTR